MQVSSPQHTKVGVAELRTVCYTNWIGGTPIALSELTKGGENT